MAGGRLPPFSLFRRKYEQGYGAVKWKKLFVLPLAMFLYLGHSVSFAGFTDRVITKPNEKINFSYQQTDIPTLETTTTTVEEPPVVENEKKVVETTTTQVPQIVQRTDNVSDFLACIRWRESRGNYTIHNLEGSGASGAYQFMPGTWNSIARSVGRNDLVGVDPAAASPEDQDAMAIALYQQQGKAPWGYYC